MMVLAVAATAALVKGENRMGTGPAELKEAVVDFGKTLRRMPSEEQLEESSAPR